MILFINSLTIIRSSLLILKPILYKFNKVKQLCSRTSITSLLHDLYSFYCLDLYELTGQQSNHRVVGFKLVVEKSESLEV